MMLRALLTFCLCFVCHVVSSFAVDTVQLWPSEPPAWTVPTKPEADVTKPGTDKNSPDYVVRLSNIRKPELHLYPAENASTTVVVCPGGGYNILAWNLEGTEVATWLQSNGVNAVVLKYRVPSRQEKKIWMPAVQDIQRAIALVRSGAAGAVKSERVGVLGFSAGGNASARAATAKMRYYEAMDDSDEASFKPDFAVLVYPAYLDQYTVDKQNGKQVKKPAKEASFVLSDEIEITKDSPPMFFAHAFDDKYSCLGSMAMLAELKKHNIPSALHVFSGGGHGFGMRPKGRQADVWLSLCKAWMNDNGWISSAH